MIKIDDLELFVRSAALGSFSSAARESSLTPNQVSTAIQRLEDELEIRLFARSTRSLKLTDEGAKYLPYAEEALSMLREGHERLHGERQTLQGTLRLALPSDLGRNVLLPWITEFRQAHPKLVLKLFLSDHVADIFRDPIDIAIRYGQPDNASYVALPLASNNRRVLVASPSYIARHGRPTTLDDVMQHKCLTYFLNSKAYDRWIFPAAGVRRQITVKGDLLCDDGDIARRWAVEGHGIAYKSWLDVCNDVTAGRLKILVPDQPGEAAPLSLICPHRRQFSPAVRDLHAMLAARLETMTKLLQKYVK
ncbi:LysR family transcriptional regulator [Bordetella tumbae]|uniref:LysR family transcriptional regulator n=1 Tax=Bordetella tumbae TaxID=1649139 RepID=UPI0039EEC199